MPVRDRNRRSPEVYSSGVRRNQSLCPLTCSVFSVIRFFSFHHRYPLRNAQSIQRPLSMVLTGLAANRIDPKIAGKMLSALQTATTNLRLTPEECRF
jgi:hypothetical protein